MFLKSSFYFLAIVAFSDTQDCEPGWFGPNCLYKSHCRPNLDCDIDATCPRDSRCERGWFGPGCQYVDLVASSLSVVTSSGTSARQVTDGDDQTCLVDSYIDDLVVTWQHAHLVVWLRLYGRETEELPRFKIEALDTEFGLSCRSVRVTKWITDIECDKRVIARQIRISGPTVGFLCSLYVSGGRNLALKHPTTQSSTMRFKNVSLTSDLAVDGDTRGWLNEQLHSCSSTNFGDNNPVWSIQFSTPKLIDQFILHNRDVVRLQNRLQGFMLSASSASRLRVFTFNDTDPIARDTYTIKMSDSTRLVSGVEIRAIKHVGLDNQSHAILQLCEVEIYGYSACDPGRYGLECEHVCNCADTNERCLMSTGGCPPGCLGDLCVESCDGGPSLATTWNLTFVWIGVGVVIIIIVITISAALVCLCGRRMKSQSGQVYDMPGPHGEYSHDYSLMMVPNSSDTLVKTVNPWTSIGNTSSNIYESVDDPDYVELTG